MPGARVGEKAPPLLDYCEISGLNEREKFGVKHGRSGKRDGVHNMFAELFRHVRSGLVLSVSHRDVAGGASVDNDVFRFQFLNMDGFSACKPVSHRDSGYQKLFKHRDKFDLSLR